jgi:hypothetical protein
MGGVNTPLPVPIIGLARVEASIDQPPSPKGFRQITLMIIAWQAAFIEIM